MSSVGGVRGGKERKSKAMLHALTLTVHSAEENLSTKSTDRPLFKLSASKVVVQ